MEPLTMETIQRMLDDLHRQRTAEVCTDLIFVPAHMKPALEWLFQEYYLDRKWNEEHRKRWWHRLTPEQQERETRRGAVYFKLECQWHRKALPLPGTPGFKIFYQDRHRDEWGDPIPR